MNMGEGTETRPFLYWEGVAQELIIECEKWARTNKCREIASDCEL